MANVAAEVRKEKEAHPERFCANPKCLWRIVTPRGANPCKNHPIARTPEPINLGQFVRDSLTGAISDQDFAKQEDAAAAIIVALANRFGRGLTRSELTTVDIEVALQWNLLHAANDRVAREDSVRRSEWLVDHQAAAVA